MLHLVLLCQQNLAEAHQTHQAVHQRMEGILLVVPVHQLLQPVQLTHQVALFQLDDLFPVRLPTLAVPLLAHWCLDELMDRRAVETRQKGR